MPAVRSIAVDDAARRIPATLLITSCLAIPSCASGPSAGDAVSCCTGFGIDARPILGAHAVDCGGYSEMRAKSANQQATNCALRAQREGRAFVYYYIDSDMVDGGRESVA